ncbi:MAG TPA: MBL fold metallo-hydrolase [Candidatus Copromorpha excrementigallinarum]|uniref:MBL fold metallo-hydrolase n=1 Tax=Candidatus Allocopromorpha excrementigallinarum TaxID=2840742 RepID=A0A9D1I1K6_9FIRM|nr:MBL fold metallo-hydrolase [Candidatus Copromorpha excrementigallinarum]
MTQEVIKNIYRIVIPLPNNPLKSLNSYFIKSDSGRNLLIDTGFNRPECLEAIEKGLADAGAVMEDTDLFITHLHSDHCGLIAHLRDKGSRVYAGKIDGDLINYETGEEYWEKLDELFVSYGFPKAKFGKNTDIHPGRKYSNEEIIDFTYVTEEDVLNVGEYSFRPVLTPGHTPGHMCLYDENKRVLISGDHILGDITPNICIELTMENPLELYLKSLDKVAALKVETILTAHRSPVPDMYKRIDQLKAHHDRRLKEVLENLHESWTSAYSMAQLMTWKIKCKSWEDFPEPQKWFATGEAVAHLQYLASHGLAERGLADGITVYRKR